MTFRQCFLLIISNIFILNNKAKVLDIGCGPGTHSIPMAQTAEEVISLDISVNMLNIIREKTQELNYSNVVPMKENWGEVNLGDKKWNKHFDLVFAPMPPGVHKYEHNKKLRCIKELLYLSSWVSGSQSRNALFQLVNKMKELPGILMIRFLRIQYSKEYVTVRISYTKRLEQRPAFEEALETTQKS